SGSGTVMRSWLRQARPLTLSEWKLAAEALMLVPLLAAASRICSPSRVCRLGAARRVGGGGTVSPETLATIVNAVASRVKAGCLTKALVLHVMLRRRGIRSALVVGAARSNGLLRAHAWVESNGRTLIGASALPYEPIWIAE